jgi:hypothetical protein
MDSHTPLRTRAPRRLSRDPPSLCRRAPSPITPGSPMRVRARCFRIGRRLRHIWEIGRCQLRVTRPNRVRICWAHVFALATLPEQRPGCSIARPDRTVSRRQLPFDAGPELHVERAIHMADTSQSAREMRVYPAHQMTRINRSDTNDSVIRRTCRRIRVPPCSSVLSAFSPCMFRIERWGEGDVEGLPFWADNRSTP